MSYLSKLDVVHNSALNPNNPTHQKRIRLIDALIEQQEMLQAMIERQPYAKYEIRLIINPTTGEQVERKMPVKLRQWYWQYDGAFYFQCYHGKRKLMIRDGMGVLYADTAEGLSQAIGILMCAVEAGEMDGQFQGLVPL